MCPLFREEDAVILRWASATPGHAIYLFTLIVLAALGDDLHPGTRLATGRAGRGGPLPPSGSTSALLLAFPVWRQR